VGVVRITNVLKMVESSPVSSLGYGNPTELYLGYVSMHFRTWEMIDPPETTHTKTNSSYLWS